MRLAHWDDVSDDGTFRGVAAVDTAFRPAPSAIIPAFHSNFALLPAHGGIDAAPAAVPVTQLGPIPPTDSSVIPGTIGVDTLNGTPNDDTISGADSGDTIHGNGGNDTIYGFGVEDLDPQSGIINAQPVASGLRGPWFAASPPGDPGHLFVTEVYTGKIKIVDLATNQTSATPFLAIPSDQISEGGEQGLLGLAFSPDYATSGKFYVDIT